jgi:hypothetical protein
MDPPPGLENGSLMVNGLQEKITLQRFVPFPNPFPVWTASPELRTFGAGLARSGLRSPCDQKSTSDIALFSSWMRFQSSELRKIHENH